MDEKYKYRIQVAKRSRLRRLLCFGLGTVMLLLVGLCVVIYTYTVKIDISYEGPDSDVSLYQTSGSGFFWTDSRLLMLSDTSTVEISASGYQSKSLFIEDSQKRATVEVELALLRRDVKVVSTVEPIQAVWRLDGAYYSSEPTFQAQLKPGKYSLGLKADNVVSLDQDIVVPFGADGSYQIEIAPKPKSTEYVIKTQPPGAKVFLNSKYLGDTPIAGEIPVDNYSLSVLKSGYRNVVDTIRVGDFGEGLVRSYLLVSGSRTVKTSLNPTGGELYLQGKLIPSGASIGVDAVGTSQLTYSKEGYTSKTITIDSGTSVVTFDLAPEFAFLVIRSQPDVLVEIDGLAVGTAPLRKRLQAREYTVTLKKAGYRTITRKVRLSSSGDSLVDEPLTLLSDHYIATSKPTYQHRVGIEFARVTPDGFTMGAPRSEVGQRANEIRRNVDFNRMVYVAQFEVTEEQYSRFLGSPSASRKPQTGVSWQEAAKFCNWLSKFENLPPFYREKEGRIIGFEHTSRGYRLLSEAEWEFIAKYHQKDQPSIFTWGDEYLVTSSAGNIADKSADGAVKKYIADYDDKNPTSADVGSYSPEISGFYDFSGNVSEWVHDMYSLSPASGRVYMNYLGDPSGQQHVIKGSNYLSASWQEFRASFRETAVGGRKDVGFRVARYIH